MSIEPQSGIAIAGLRGAAVGLEREGSCHASGPEAHFAGIRTFTLLGGSLGVAGCLWTRHFESAAIVLLAGGTALGRGRLCRGQPAPCGRHYRSHGPGGISRRSAGWNGCHRLGQRTIRCHHTPSCRKAALTLHRCAHRRCRITSGGSVRSYGNRHPSPFTARSSRSSGRGTASPAVVFCPSVFRIELRGLPCASRCRHRAWLLCRGPAWRVPLVHGCGVYFCAHQPRESERIVSLAVGSSQPAR